jgi:DNA polymerase-1
MLFNPDQYIQRTLSLMSLSMSADVFVLVDGSSYLFRAFYALPNLTSPGGMPTGAILGVLNMLNRLLEDIDPHHMAVVFDAKGKNFRHEWYPAYKANRAKMPEELAVQIEPLHELIRLLGIPVVIESGVEADDVIGTLATSAAKAGQKVLISSGDKDMAQLVNEQITLMDTMKEVTYDAAGVKEKFGVWPAQMIDYLTLIGDVSDNVPGVEKVGPKTAVKWLDQYQTLDNLLAHAADIPGKIGENLEKARETLPLSKKLIQIVCDVPLAETWSQLIRQSPQTELLIERFQTYGFKTWLKKYSQQESQSESFPLLPSGGEMKPNQSTLNRYLCIQTEEAFSAFLTELKAVSAFAVDTETTSLDEMTASLVGLSFSWKVGEGFYIPLNHVGLDFPVQLKEPFVLEALKPILAATHVLKIGQNLKYDIKILSRYGLTLQGPMFDTMLASFVLEAGQTRHDLETLAHRHLNRASISYESITGKGAKALNFSEVDLAVATEYAAEDAELTYALYEVFSLRLGENPTLKAVFETIEMPLVPVLADIERRGVLIDADMLRAQSLFIGNALVELEKKAFAEAGQEFNLASPKQLQFILFEKMQLPVIKKTPKGDASTAEEVLQELAESYDLPSVILEYRHLSKLRSTYTEKLPQEINLKTGRVHTHYHQAGAATGRLSSSDPNLQNIPIRTEQGRLIRKAFIAPSRRLIVAADYSQVELRIMAHFSGDETLIRAFSQGEDIHRATAAEVFEVPVDQVTPEMRRRAKAINFGLIYGMSAFGLAKQLGVGREEAGQYIERYFQKYPGVRQFMEETRERASELGYVETAFGRRLFLPDIRSKQPMLRKAAERAAINAPLQGTAADMIKKAMIRIDEKIQTTPGVSLIMQVHDELVFEVEQACIEETKAWVSTLMVEAGKTLSVPFKVDVGVGKNWDEAH